MTDKKHDAESEEKANERELKKVEKRKLKKNCTLRKVMCAEREARC